jgi:hypothetical protein
MRRTTAAVTAALLLALCPPALADDASLWRAYNGRQGEISRGMDAFVKASDRFASKPSARRAKAAIAGNARMIRIIGRLIGDVRAENASSDSGASAKRFALKGLREWRSMHAYYTRMLRAFIHHHPASVKRWGRRAIRVGRRSEKDIGAADAAFKQAGYTHG